MGGGGRRHARSPRPWRSWTGRSRGPGGLSIGSLGLGDEEREEFCADAERLVRNYFALEDPGRCGCLAPSYDCPSSIGTLTLSGIIDRLDLDADGGLVVTDYKTGRAPSIQREQSRLGGVHFYAFLCEQVLGRRPARVQLLHLREPLAISTVPSDQSIQGLRQQITRHLERGRAGLRPGGLPSQTRAGSATTAPTTSTARQSAAT